MTETIGLPTAVARELAYTSVGKAHEGWTVVAREDIDTTRWESHHYLVIRNKAGEHYAGEYSQGLTEYQDTRPWEHENEVVFERVVPVERTVVVIDYVTPQVAKTRSEQGQEGS